MGLGCGLWTKGLGSGFLGLGLYLPLSFVPLRGSI